MNGTQQILFPESYLCECVDKFLVCKSEAYITYHRFKVGKKPDYNDMLKIKRIRDIICGSGCGLCEDEIDRMRQELNKLIV